LKKTLGWDLKGVRVLNGYQAGKNVTVQVPLQGELNRAIFPVKNIQVDTYHAHMKHPKLTFQLRWFPIGALFLQKNSQKRGT
jgi:hypothetical protein